MTIHDESYGVPTGVVPKIVPMMEDKSKIVPMMDTPMTVGNVVFGPGGYRPEMAPLPNFYPGLPAHYPQTPNVPYQPMTPNVFLTDEVKKQIEDSYNKNKAETKKHSHYFKDVSKLETIDVYRVLDLFDVTNQALGHAIKKLLVAGGRGAGKSIEKDIQEAIDTLLRYQEIQKENNV